MTTNIEHLKFPSGRTVAAARKDAKKRSDSKHVPLSQALNEVAKENGSDQLWSHAMASLSAQESSAACPDNIFSCDSVTLLALQKEAKAAAKVSGCTLEEELLAACRRHSFDDPVLAAKALFATVHSKEVHRILVGPILLTLSAFGKDLYIDGAVAPHKPTSGDIYHLGQIVYGDVTILDEAKGGETNMNRRPLNKGWWLCKYSISEPRIDLSTITLQQVGYIAHLFGLVPIKDNSRIMQFRVFMTVVRDSMLDSPIFESIRKWAKSHPKLALQGVSVYSGNWGAKALAEPKP